MSLPLEEWAERYARAWEAADAEAAAALFTEDATYRADPFGDPYQGREGVRRYWAPGHCHSGKRRSGDRPNDGRWQPCGRGVVDADGR